MSFQKLQGPGKIDIWGGGIFIYSCSTSLFLLKSIVLKVFEHEYMNMPPVIDLPQSAVAPSSEFKTNRRFTFHSSLLASILNKSHMRGRCLDIIFAQFTVLVQAFSGDIKL